MKSVQVEDMIYNGAKEKRNLALLVEYRTFLDGYSRRSKSRRSESESQASGEWKDIRKCSMRSSEDLVSCRFLLIVSWRGNPSSLKRSSNVFLSASL